MPFDIALTGLNAAQSDLEVISNNIANSETTGFKKSRTEFADLYANSQFGVASNAIGQGVQLASVSQQFTDGDVSFTENALDLAISGQGFFIVEDSGVQQYTRAGAFGLDESGNVVNALGNNLIGFQSDSSGNITGTTGPMVVSRADIAPQVTSNIDIGANLSASSPILPAFALTAGGEPDPSTFNNQASLTVYDSLGGEHLASLYFRKDSVTPNPAGDTTDWETFLFVDGVQVDGPDILTFDASGLLTQVNAAAGSTATSAPFSPGGDGAPTTVTVDYGDLTQFGSAFGISALSQDGFETGRLASLDFTQNGTLFARYSNGRSFPFGQVALANFANVQGLRPQGNTLWSETFLSGIPTVGEPGSTDLGLLQSGALESSNVDITAELINMIQTQRFFQANAQVVGAADELTQSIINII